jgi:hypothetical protein
MIVLGMGKAHDRQSFEAYQNNCRGVALCAHGEPYQALRQAIKGLAEHCRSTAQPNLNPPPADTAA